MARSSGCPKCGGSVLPERQVDGSMEFCCLQCGRMLSKPEVLQRISHASIGVSGPGVMAMSPDGPMTSAQTAEQRLAT